MAIRTLLLALSVFIIQCSASHDSPQTLDQSQHDQRENGRASSACFPGNKSQGLCLDQLVATPLPMQTDLYQYPNPLTDPEFPKDFNTNQYISPDRFLDLRQISANLALSEHFDRGELMLDGAARGYFGIFNPRVLEQLERLRAKIGKPLIITGGFRSPGRNAQLEKAAKFSRHTYGDGIDFRVNGMSYQQLRDICYEFNAGFALAYTDHVHCDWRKTPLDSAYFPTPSAPISQTSEKMILQAVQGTARIHREGATLSIAMFSDDPESDPYVEWTVLTPGGARLTSTNPNFILPDEKGLYLVQAYVGLQFHLESQVVVP